MTVGLENYSRMFDAFMKRSQRVIVTHCRRSMRDSNRRRTYRTAGATNSGSTPGFIEPRKEAGSAPPHPLENSVERTPIGDYAFNRGAEEVPDARHGMASS